jgi:predicted GNAT family N-acyltransferase
MVFTPSERRALREAIYGGLFAPLIKKYRAEGFKVRIEPYDDNDRGGAYTLAQVVVPKEARGKGKGSAFMRELVGLADQHEVTLATTPSKDFGATSLPRLKRFYKAHGFVDNKGKHKDWSTRATMIRQPKGMR